MCGNRLLARAIRGINYIRLNLKRIQKILEINCHPSANTPNSILRRIMLRFHAAIGHV